MATKKTATYTSPVDMLSVIGELEKVAKIQSITLGAEDRVSTGNLCLDLILGGGISPSMMTFAGGEQSAKTTTAISVMGASVDQKVGLRVLWDAEGSSGSSTDYISNIFRTMGVKVSIEELFGRREKGKYTTAPLVYYRDEGELKTFFDWTAALLRRLPDKRFEGGRWWYIYERTKENLAAYKGQADRAMSSANNAIYIPAEDGALQALLLIDSWPSLLPAGLDEDEAKAGMALSAREFSQHLPRLKGKLRSKRVALLGINQLRERPGFNMGDPRYEPGGQALRFLSDVRIWYTARALSGVPFSPKGKGMVEEEPSVSVDGGTDTYRYIHARAIKNKLSVPGRETWLRIWVQDAEGNANGLDPVWDAFYVLHLTGQVSGKRSSMLLDVEGLGPAKKNISWQEFKMLVIGSKEQRDWVCAKLGYSPLNLRKGLFRLMERQRMEERYIENRIKAGRPEAAPADEDEDDDD